MEGAFLGWHDSTLTCYMYSFRLQRVLRVQDAVFDHDDEYPFLDPKCLVTQGMLTDNQVKEMHATGVQGALLRSWSPSAADDCRCGSLGN
eukprot:1970674-Rhodomonas_salina.1